MDDLTLSVVLTAAGATASAALITGLIAILRQLVVIGPLDPGGPRAHHRLRPVRAAGQRRGALGGRVHARSPVRRVRAWFGIAQIAMGVHDTTSAQGGGRPQAGRGGALPAPRQSGVRPGFGIFPGGAS